MYTQATVRYHTPPYSYASRLGRFFKVLMVALRWRENEKGCPGFALGGEKRYIYIYIEDIAFEATAVSLSLLAGYF